MEWRTAFREFLRHPVVGGGFGLHLEFFHPLWFKRLPEWWFVHNSYLLFLVKTGLLGLALFLYFKIAVLRLAGRAVRCHGNGLPFCLAVGFLANLVQFMVIAFTNYTYCKANNTPYMAFVIGAVAVLARMQDGGPPGGEEPWESDPLRGIPSSRSQS
jgi:O-antigen ligase